MKHLNEEQMILHHYKETDAPPDAAQHLAGCAECRRTFAALQRVLSTVEALPVPERGEDYGAQVWQRLRPRLGDKPARAGFDWLRFPQPQRLVWAGAIAVLLMAAFLAGRFSPRSPDESPNSVAQSAEQVRERILVVAVGDHLERSQMLLVELVNSPEKTGLNLAADQQVAEDLVSANRLYRQTAARAGETAVAGVLDELERVLVEIANSPPELSAVELDRLRKRIEAHGILFKVRVVESQMRAREKQARKTVAGLT